MNEMNDTSHSSSWHEKYFRQKSQRNSKHTFQVQKLLPPPLWDYVAKNGTAGQATDGNMAHAFCMLGT